MSENNTPMKNITINIPDLYDVNIKKLIKMKLIPSRSEAVRTALREFLLKEYNNLEVLGFFENKNQIFTEAATSNLMKITEVITK